jgi:predicted nucleotidyltransferase
MSVLGIIAEYNPFHNGHLYHLQKAQSITQAETTIVVMSGQFVQRGEPALIDKWKRAELALKHGVDLVIELPTAYAIQSAELFAYGAVSILEQLRATSLVFGSESSDISKLGQIATLLYDESSAFSKSVKNNLDTGVAYPRALALAIEQQLPASIGATAKSNDILGIQYLLAIKRLNSEITAIPIERILTQYTDQIITNEQIASATAIRNSILNENNLNKLKTHLPDLTFWSLADSLQKGQINSWQNYYKSVQILLHSYSSEQLSGIHGMEESLENRLKAAAQIATNFNQLVELSISKRYTNPRIKRTLLNLLLNLTKELYQQIDLQAGAPYLRVLGFNQNGQNYLNKIKKEITVPVITKIPRDRALMLDFDLAASSIYNLGINSFDQPTDYNRIPIIIE